MLRSFLCYIHTRYAAIHLKEPKKISTAQSSLGMYDMLNYYQSVTNKNNKVLCGLVFIANKLQRNVFFKLHSNIITTFEIDNYR